MEHHNKGNKHASKPLNERSDAVIYVRCMDADKEAWKAARGNITLSAWINKVLNAAVTKIETVKAINNKGLS